MGKTMLLARGGEWWRAIKVTEAAVTEVLGMGFHASGLRSKLQCPGPEHRDPVLKWARQGRRPALWSSLKFYELSNNF